MAEALPPKEEDVKICWFFAANKTCKFGETCPFRHVETDRPLICRYYMQDRCRFGERCRFLHPFESDSENDENLDKYVFGDIGTESSSTSSGPVREWAQAPEFIPNKQSTEGCSKSYASAVKKEDKDLHLCPYFITGNCDKGNKCQFLHGLKCDFCNTNCLHPNDEAQRKAHTTECIKQHEKDMETSFAIARSKGKNCGICYEEVIAKRQGEQRFGILPMCNHCFCLSCLRTWRQARHFENQVTRSCPLCRTPSDFVCPSMYWVETKEDKNKLIDDYKAALKVKHCKYFKKGQGNCPFGNKCFYSHALNDGTAVDVGPPNRNRRRRFGLGRIDSNIDTVQIVLWDFLQFGDSNLLYEETDSEYEQIGDSDMSDSDSEY